MKETEKGGNLLKHLNVESIPLSEISKERITEYYDNLEWCPFYKKGEKNEKKREAG